MKIIVAPDSFKGTLRAVEVCRIWREVFECVSPETQVVCIPMADGGEGSLEAVVAATGAERKVTCVSDPLGRSVKANWALLPDGTAFIEAAEANGLERITAAERNPRVATTYGVGELIADALGQGVRSITIGIGGSATVDGGSGMLQALGYKLLDADGNELQRGGAPLAKLRSVVAPKLPSFTLNVACDVVNPLLGANGAARVFGPQKGATPEMVEELETALTKYASVLVSSGIANSCDVAGDGAAGGLGFALRAVLGGRPQSGARLLAGLAHFEEHLEGASWMITGEGCSDEQTLSGKLPAVLAELAKQHNVPSILCSGAIKGDSGKLSQLFQAVFSTVQEVEPLESVLAKAEINLIRTAQSIAALLK